jgi:hypothetical protein
MLHAHEYNNNQGCFASFFSPTRLPTNVTAFSWLTNDASLDRALTYSDILLIAILSVNLNKFMSHSSSRAQVRVRRGRILPT